MELPKEELTTASGYSIQSLIAAAARASKTLPVPGSRKRAAAARASKTLPVPASRKRAAVARAGALPAQPAAEQKPKVKPKAKQAATVPARARVKVAAKDAEQSSAAAAAAAAGASQVRKRKREALAGGSAAASTVIASKRGNAAVRRIKVGQRSVSEMAASMPTAVKAEPAAQSLAQDRLASSRAGPPRQNPARSKRGAAIAAAAAMKETADEVDPRQSGSTGAAAATTSLLDEAKGDGEGTSRGIDSRRSKAAARRTGVEPWADAAMVLNMPTIMKVLPERAVARAGRTTGTELQLPPSLIRMAGMQSGPVIVKSEDGSEWQTVMRQCSRPGSNAIFYCICKGWPVAVTALQLDVGDIICLAALGSGGLLVSRCGEPHFSAAVRQGLPDPWPLTVALTHASVSMCKLPLSCAAGRSICPEGVQRAEAVVVPHVPSAGPNASSYCEYSVTIVVLARSRQRYQYFISGGWQALARGLGLTVGDRVQLQPLSRDPWRLRLSLEPADSAASARS